VLLVAAWTLASCERCRSPKSPYDVYKKPVGGLGFKALKTAEANLAPGWIIRSTDQEPFFTDCYTGTIKKGTSFKSYKSTHTAKTSASLKATLGKYADAFAKFERLTSVEIEFDQLRTDRIVDIKLTLDKPKCELLAANMTALKALLSFDKVRMKVSVKQGFDLGATVKEIKTGLGKVAGGANVSSTSDGTLEVTGAKLYVGYRVFDQTSYRHSKTYTITNGKQVSAGNIIRQQRHDTSQPNDYAIRFDYDSTSSKGRFSVTSASPSFLTSTAATPFTLSSGQRFTLQKTDHFSSVLVVEKLTADSVEVRLSEWFVELSK